MKLLPLKSFNNSSYRNIFFTDDDYNISVSLKHQKVLEIETSVTIEIMRDIEQLTEIYVLKDSAKVRRFLWENKFLVDILFEARGKIIEIFGSDVTLYLELHSDIEEGWDELFIVIKSPYSPEKTVELDKKLFEEWFVYKIDETFGKLNIIEEPL